MYVYHTHISLRFSPLSIIKTGILHSATPRSVSSFLSSFVYRLACMVLVDTYLKWRFEDSYLKWRFEDSDDRRQRLISAPLCYTSRSPTSPVLCQCTATVSLIPHIFP